MHMALSLDHDAVARDGTGAALARILVIEDDDGTAEEVLTALGDHGYLPERASSGTEGLERARAGDWDVLVVDRMLPGLDGLALIESLRNDQIMTPVLVLSAMVWSTTGFADCAPAATIISPSRSRSANSWHVARTHLCGNDGSVLDCVWSKFSPALAQNPAPAASPANVMVLTGWLQWLTTRSSWPAMWTMRCGWRCWTQVGQESFLRHSAPWSS